MIQKNIINNIDIIKKMYSGANPFPHAIFDNFLDANILEICLKEIQEYQDWFSDRSIANYQVNKFYVPACDSDDEMYESLKTLAQKAPITHAVLNYLYSNDTLKFLSNLTGIQNLIPDSSWFGAGIHKVKNGGKLAVHADFNLNWKTNKYRRINLLLYLNKNWKEEYNGHLELWARDMSSCVTKIPPIFNRAVIFNTDKTSYHGHTAALNIPEDMARYSLALYYYTEEPPPDDEDQRFVTWKNTFE